ncbi:MAG: signal peptidase I [Candidatus Saelkia tenebricola]|nr:signal peptidase I [Candidatus Saelkia tenebricola]
MAKEIRKKHVAREWAESIVIALLAALVIRTFIIEAFKIPSGSMKPTLEIGDRIFVSKFIYRYKEPQRGDIVVFRYPENPKKYFVKRLIAMGNEVVGIEDGNITIDGELVKNPEILQKFYYYNKGQYGLQDSEVQVPDENFYFLGDNSAFSKDSRYWGYVPRKNIVGKAFLRFWPLWRIGLVR